MSAITNLAEDFAGGTVGSAIALDPTTIFETDTGTGAASTVQTLDGSRCMRNAPGGTDFRLYRADYTAVANFWRNFYFALDTGPTSNTAVYAVNSGATKICDVRFLPGNIIQLRSGSSARWESAPLATGVKHRFAVQVAPNAAGTGTLRLRIYEGTLRDSVQPTQDSGPQTAGVAAATTDNERVGALTADATLVWRVQRMRADNAVEPAGATVVNTVPTVRAEAVVFSELEEDFKGGAAGANITTSNTIFDSETGTGTPSKFAVLGGRPAMRCAPGGTDFRLYRSDYAAQADLSLSFPFQLDALPAANTAIWACYSGTTKIADIQIPLGTRTLRLRSVNTERWVSAPFELGVEHRLVVRVKPLITGNGIISLEIHEGATRDSTVPTQKSGDQVASATVATSDNVRFGALSADATLDYLVGRIRANPAGFPQAIEPGATFTLQAVASDPDPGGSVVAHQYVQTAGPPVPLTGSGTGPRTGVAPYAQYGAELAWTVTAVDNAGGVSTPDSLARTVHPHNLWACMADGSRRPIILRTP